MNARDRVRTTLTRGRPDRFPKVLAFREEHVPGLPDTAEQLRLDVRFIDFAAPADQAEFLAYLRVGGQSRG